MPDQADELRRLANMGAFESVGLPRSFDHHGPDKSRLWDELKAELLVESHGPAERHSLDYKTIGGFDPRRASAMLDRMQQAETLASVREYKVGS